MRPSEQLIRLIRETATKRGLNTAALATEAGVSRSELKHVLAGGGSLTVDMLVLLAGVLDLGQDELAALSISSPEDEAEPHSLQAVRRQTSLTDLPVLDPYGNHAEQILRLGFALGCDIHVVLQSDRLDECGLPSATLDQFPDLLPIKLDAAYHHHNDPRFFPDGVQLTLSFDSLYTCTIPWEAFEQLTLIPLEPELSDVLDPPPTLGAHLRLIE
jgi:transcriptional regulator with XRE-family HTH domain